VSNSEVQPSTPDRAVEAGRGALFIGFAKAFFMVAGFLQRVLLARVISPAEYGAFSVVNNAISTVNNTMVQGTIQSVSKFTAEDDKRAGAVQRAGLKMQCLLAFVVALAFVLLAPVLARSVRAPEHTALFRLVALIPLIYAFYSVYVGTANGLRKFRLQASFDVGFSTAKTVLLLGGAFVGHLLGHSVAGAFVGFVAAALLILAVAGRTIGLRGDGQSFPPVRLFTFMLGVVLYTLLINLALNYDLLLLRRFAGEAAPGAAADALAGAYEAVRNLALLPYQALLVVTFVIFPLVSRATFAEDGEATKAYVRQTLRYALILGAGLAVVLAARPAALLAILYPKAYGVGAQALPILAGGIVALALLSIAGSIVTASGRPDVSVGLVALTLAVGSALAFAMVPRATPGPAMLAAAASATAFGMLAGLLAALVYLWRRFAALPPMLSVLRVGVTAVAAIAAARMIPGDGKLVGLVAAAVAGAVFAIGLVVLREFGSTDKEKFAKILKLKPRR
jgi:O-antigen/teichoic acid export membrane protein